MTSSTFPAILDYMDKYPEPSRRLDALLAGALGVVVTPRVHPAVAVVTEDDLTPPYSTNLEYARRGVPEGWAFSIAPGEEGWIAKVFPRSHTGRDTREYVGESSVDQPEMALIKAWVKARCQ